MRPAQRAQLALLLEVAGTPKPGNVDRHRDYPDLRFEHFLAGAVGAADGLEMAADGEPLGAAFEAAVAGMGRQSGGNTQFGALLLLVPLVRAAAEGDLTRAGATAVAEATTVADAKAFYRAFDHVAVAVDDPPADLDDLDVRRGADAVPAVERRGLTLHGVMALSADPDGRADEPVAGRDVSVSGDGVAREWVSGFERSFAAADRLADDPGPVADRAARVFLELLADEPDTFVAIQHDAATARDATERAAAALDGAVDPAALADDFVAAGVNPGTTADLVAAGLFVALERGEVVV